MQKTSKIRCAIYTRKSHEEGLEQEFNSLDAQRVSAEAYVQSQIHEGWEVLPTRYDYPGFSGGTLERPALQRLLHDIKEGMVDIIVVYKVDRLSRSLMDFSKLVEIFDAKNVSFVSVTQAFNTTNSMGRLTLNILLSFAQFEREVTGERIRDKLAASKQKGMWMGGVVPLGYEVRDRKLILNEAEAQRVRYIFEKYLEIKSVRTLTTHLNQIGYMRKVGKCQEGQERASKPFSRSVIRTILSNQLYLGKMPHKGQIFDGEHQSIVDQALFDKVQEVLIENATDRSSEINEKHDILFKGRLFDRDGNRFTTTSSHKPNKRIYYYLNRQTNARISVVELNGIITHAMSNLDLDTSYLPNSEFSKDELISRYYSSIDAVVKNAISRVVLHDQKISILLDKSLLLMTLADTKILAHDVNPVPLDYIKIADRPECIEISLQVAFKGYGKKMAYTLAGKAVSIHKTNHEKSLIQAIVRSYKWNHLLDNDPAASVKDIATRENVERTYVGDVLRLKYLAPEIVTMILHGTQPRSLKVSHLIRQPIPLCWDQQKKLLNIA